MHTNFFLDDQRCMLDFNLFGYEATSQAELGEQGFYKLSDLKMLVA